MEENHDLSLQDLTHSEWTIYTLMIIDNLFSETFEDSSNQAAVKIFFQEVERLNFKIPLFQFHGMFYMLWIVEVEASLEACWMHVQLFFLATAKRFYETKCEENTWKRMAGKYEQKIIDQRRRNQINRVFFL